MNPRPKVGDLVVNHYGEAKNLSDVRRYFIFLKEVDDPLIPERSFIHLYSVFSGEIKHSRRIFLDDNEYYMVIA